MESATKTFGPIEVLDDPEMCVVVRDSEHHAVAPFGHIEEMIKALRDAADWLEQRQKGE